MSKNETHIESLFRKIIWFDNRQKYDIDFFELFEPQRVVKEHRRYKSGVFFSEKCNREIQYESNLELNFIKLLETHNKVKFYFEQPVRISYMRGRRKDSYTPDFAVFLESKEVVIIEVKDLSGMLENRVQMKSEALLKFCYRKGFGLLITDGKQTIDKIRKTKSNRNLEKHMLDAVSDNRILRKKACNTIMKDCKATQNELLKVILKKNLKYRSFPFQLQEGSRNKIFQMVFVEQRKYEDILEEKYQKLFK